MVIKERIKTIAWKADGFEWIKLDILRIPNYQRLVSQEWVKVLTNHFDINKVGVITINLRDDNHYYLIDGQHRVCAAKKSGVDALPALIFIGLTSQDEADLRLHINSHKADKTIDIFKLRLEAHDQTALSIMEILRVNGLKLYIRGGESVGSSHNPNVISCVGALDAIYHEGGPDRLHRVLQIATKTWPIEPSGRGAVVLRGLNSFLSRYSEVNDIELIDKLRKHHPMELSTAARLRLKDSLGEGSIATHFGKVILAQYNYRRSTHKLPDRYIGRGPAR